MSATARFAEVPRASGGITRLALERLRENDVNVTPLLRQAGLSASELDDPKAWISVAAQIKFLEAAAQVLDDPLLGFHLARDFEPRQVGLVYFVMASSATLADALARADRYGKVVNEGLLLSCVPRQDLRVRLKHFGVARHSDLQQVEFFITTLVRLCRRFTGQDALAPSLVRLAHRRPEDMSELAQFVGATIEFAAGVDEVVFPRDAGHQPLINADRYLNELLTRYCDEALAARPALRNPLRSRVEDAIVPLLPHGTPSARRIAAEIGMSYRTLARRLAREHMTFDGILADLRADLAERYLKDDDLTISQIAWLLGYREVSSFTNAYKKRTGRTPTEARSREMPPRTPPELASDTKR
jgi:AraC-like DNA-binding protein